MASMAEPPDPHAGEGIVGPRGSTDDDGRDHGHDDHAHAGTALGPIDVPRWAAAAVGVLLGLLVVLALIQALS
jgi:hypothetical protein